MTYLLYWAAFLAVVFPYLGYPLTLRLLTRGDNAYNPQPPSQAVVPKVTFIISAYNEEAVIAAKLDNALAIDYPRDEFQVVVISDASDDQTDTIVRTYADKDPRVVLFRQDERKGKTSGLNGGIALASGDVVVFSDANAMYAPDAIRHLVAPLADPRVGYVVGAAHYTDSDSGEAQQSEGLYWRYELALKEMESAYGSVVGGDGAIYAIRRELYWPLREDDINDFVNPLQIIAAGYRGVFNPEACCYEESADSFAKEFGRKRRIVNRSWRAFRRYGTPLFRAGNPRFVFQLLAHKVLRWFALPALVLLGLTNLLLVAEGAGAFYTLTAIGMLLSVVLALRGRQMNASGRPMPRLVYLFYYFYLVNIAAILGIYDEARGIRHSKWNHVRS